MERNYMKSDSLVELEFLTDDSKKIHYHENIELLFVINGKIEMKVEEQSWTLRQRDMIVINPNSKHAFCAAQNVLLARFSVSYSKVKELTGRKRVCFWCNSSADQGKGYEQLREIVHSVIHQAFQPKDRTQLFMNSMYYQMLHVLVEHFLVGEITEKESGPTSEERMQEIFDYIRENYRENISLQDIAEKLYLSTAYVSRYIKQKCDMTFMELMNQVRLRHAMEDMLYTDESITKIAMNNGFASLAAFNKVFKIAYDATPTEYRRKRKDKHKEATAEQYHRRELIEKQVDEYLGQNPMEVVKESEQCRLKYEINLDQCQNWECENATGLMVNVGKMSLLTDARVQEQLLDCKRILHTRYVRVEDIFDPALHLYSSGREFDINTGKLDSICDFLVKNGLKLYMELSDKPILINRTPNDTIVLERNEISLESDQQIADFYGRLFGHLVKRYGEGELGEWYFDYWEDMKLFGNKEELKNKVFSFEEIHRLYLLRFQIIAGLLRKYAPEAKIGGAGFLTRILGKEKLSRLLALWNEQKEKPDFISIHSFPYIFEKTELRIMEKRNADPNFVEQHICTTKEAMQMAGMGELPIHVTEYALSLSDRNPVNDSCYNGAWVMYNALDCMDKAEILGYWVMSDIHSEYDDTLTPLFGGTGLFSKDGICKPSMYALDYIARLYRKVCFRAENCVVTRNGKSNVRIVCHNMKTPGIHYYLKREDTILLEDVSTLSEDCSHLTLNFRMTGMEDGRYLVGINMINKKYGSVQELWKELNCEKSLSMQEMDYLKKAAISKALLKELEVKDGFLELETTLMPDEIQYLYVCPK